MLRAKHQPVIVFSNVENQEKQANQLKIFCRKIGLKNFFSILTLTQAREMRNSAKGELSGVWFVSPAFSRGYDLKFGKDAFVIVVDSIKPEKKFNLTQVQQMVGRGSRSFGISHGYVLLNSDKLLAN